LHTLQSKAKSFTLGQNKNIVWLSSPDQPPQNHADRKVFIRFFLRSNFL